MTIQRRYGPSVSWLRAGFFSFLIMLCILGLDGFFLANALSQSGPLRGDLNGDDVVDLSLYPIGSLDEKS